MHTTLHWGDPFGTIRLAVCLFTLATASSVPGAVVFEGEVSPADPSSWKSNIEGFIGKSPGLTGSALVDGGSYLDCSTGYVGYSSGSTGTATVSGAGSKWTNSSLYVGNSGSGALTVEAGGR